MPAPSINLALLSPRRSVEQVELGAELAPRFGDDGLLPCVTTDAGSGEVLMVGWMNAEALQQTLATGLAHYFSRSRRALWRKGATSGLTQHVVEARIDDDQDAVWLRVRVAGVGASCHVGYRSCFYRCIDMAADGRAALRFVESGPAFDARAVYADAPNPTRL
jgi:phosphoribosyl-AMP cyclohydrolase